ncbi:ParB/RepB/Spo0J family partition protein [Haloactinomyces albus]|uniref:ParB/RepB/Spo0J family partition protein n=1 Tax=Haloactinomyces albus TaxID=1352928 RepID=A0AAE3ZGP9_9ACTN|nr:ParB/RepB/Spo0J family partition protein [Haloactinomyces albus]
MPVNGIAHNPRNPRDHYDDIEELAESIHEYGLLQPLGVVRYEIFLGRYPEFESEIGSAHWVVIQGNRRLTAARRADLAEVPVVIQERLGREDVFDESTLIENVHRTDLPPLREAALLRELLDKYGSQRKLAGKIKKSQGYISQRLSLLDLVPEMQDALARGEITVVQARNLAGIPLERQRRAVEAGPPYEDPDASIPEPVVTPVASESQMPDVEAPSVEPVGDYAVITHSVNGSSHGTDVPDEAAAVSDGPAVVSTRPPQPKRKLPAPSELAARLAQEYTTEERNELVRLLQA